MHTLLIIPDGTGIRNFLCTRFMDRLLAEGPVTVWHGLDAALLQPYMQRYGCQAIEPAENRARVTESPSASGGKVLPCNRASTAETRGGSGGTPDGSPAPAAGSAAGGAKSNVGNRQRVAERPRALAGGQERNARGEGPTALPGGVPGAEPLLGCSVRWVSLPAYREGLWARLLRQAKLHAQMRWFYHEDNADSVFKMNFRYPSRDWRQRLLTWGSRFLGRLCATRSGTQWLDRQHAAAIRRAGSTAPFAAFLAQEKPDVVFCVHQRASRAVPAMLAARDLGIPTATFVYSWDNLPKGRMAVHADHYFVWSDYMKAEMAKYYPEVPGDRVHVTGTPQFEPYFDESLYDTREAFFAAHGLDPARPVILYSGDDHMASPYDAQYLADLAAALRAWPDAGGQCAGASVGGTSVGGTSVGGTSVGGTSAGGTSVTDALTHRRTDAPAPDAPSSPSPLHPSSFILHPSPRPQLLFRRCPTDTSGRHDPVLQAYPEIRVSAPRWQAVAGDWTQVVPTLDDVRLLVNVVRHCDLVINVGSTMAMDFAILDKPAAYIAYDPARLTPGEPWNQRDFYRHPHFRPLLQLEPVWWVRTPQEYVPRLAEALAHGEAKRAARRAWYERHACQPLPAATARLVAALRTIARREKAEIGKAESGN